MLKGSTISRFPVRLLSQLPDGGTAGIALVLARGLGRRLSSLGGVPHGASGSPVYIGHRLIGAISASFYPDPRLIGITPKEAILSLANEPSPSPSLSYRPAAPKHEQITAVGLTSERALGEVETRFGHPRVGQTLSKQIVSSNLRAGSAIGAALLVGDIKLGFIGTATIVNRDRLFAFGHPLLFSGPSGLPLTTVQIADIARGNPPSKIGVIGETIGTVLEDRAAGIYARIGQMPNLVPIHCSIRDDDRQLTTTLATQAAPLTSEITFLVFIAAIESMQRAMNRVGSGSASWQWTVQPVGVDHPVTVEGAAYDLYDIGLTVAAAIMPTINELLQAGVTIGAIELQANVTARRIADAPSPTS